MQSSTLVFVTIAILFQQWEDQRVRDRRGPLRRVQVSGRVVNAEGQPLSDAHIEAVVRYGDHDPSSSIIRRGIFVDAEAASAMSGHSGRFQIEIPGSLHQPWLVWFSATAPGYSVGPRFEHAVGPDALDGVEITLFADRGLQGRVVDDAGASVLEARVRALPALNNLLSAPGEPDAGQRITFTNASGDFEFDAVPACPYTLHPTGPGVQADTAVLCLADHPESEAVVLPVRRCNWIGIHVPERIFPLTLRLELEEVDGDRRSQHSLEFLDATRIYVNELPEGRWKATLRSPHDETWVLPELTIRSSGGRWLEL